MLRRELLRAGVSADEIRRHRRRQELAAVRRGAYVNPHDERAADDVGRHRLTVQAAVRQLGPEAVVSHVSAAVVHGLPVWGLPLGRVHVTRDRTSGARIGRDVHVHAAALDVDEIMLVDGILVTTPARTVLDLARSAPFEPAVAVADAALGRPRPSIAAPAHPPPGNAALALPRPGDATPPAQRRPPPAGAADDLPPLTTPAELAEALERATRRPGAARARRVVAFADGRSESVGESRSRVAIAAAGLPPPVLQWVVHSASGLFIGRVDFGWPQYRTVGEFDGRVKYGRLLRPGQDPGDVVYEEKLREDALRAEDLVVVRWTWPAISRFAETATRLRSGFRP